MHRIFRRVANICEFIQHFAEMDANILEKGFRQSQRKHLIKLKVEFINTENHHQYILSAPIEQVQRFITYCRS
jgi:hypothetical protein